jgi:hypothetical protein
MVAMAISLLLLSGVISIFVSSKSSYETNERLSRIQENGRFALNSIMTGPACVRIRRLRAPADLSQHVAEQRDDAAMEFSRRVRSRVFRQQAPARGRQPWTRASLRH